MNYFEIFNKVMLELNLKPVLEFENISKNEHLRILENIKRANLEVCTGFKWNFLNKNKGFELPKGEKCIFLEGAKKINSVFVDGTKFFLDKNYEKKGKKLEGGNFYAIEGKGKIVFCKHNLARFINVFYETSNYAKNEKSVPVANFEGKFDKSIIPDPYGDELLIYGATLLTKANPAFVKYPFWDMRYKMALKRLISNCAPDGENEPEIRVNRQKCAQNLRF